MGTQFSFIHKTDHQDINVHKTDHQDINVHKTDHQDIISESSLHHSYPLYLNNLIGCRGCDRMIVGFITTCTYVFSAYYHLHCDFEPYSWSGLLDTTLCDKVDQ